MLSGQQKNQQSSIFKWFVLINPKRAGLFGPISQPGGRIPPPKISKTDWRNIKCVVLVDSYDPPESIVQKKYKHTLYDVIVIS